MWNRVVALAIALAVGLIYGAAGSVTQAGTWLDLPTGVTIAVIGAAALLLALRLLTADRWMALAGGLGMMIATFVLSQPSAGGSVLFTQLNEVQALVWMAAVPLCTALVVAWPNLSRLAGAGTTQE